VQDLKLLCDQNEKGAEAMSMEYIRKTYNVPAKRGGRVMLKRGRVSMLGTIVRATHYVYIRFDDSKLAVPFHPKDDSLSYLPDKEKETKQ
jgi:uncharacterized protein (DUF1330 family)